MSGKPKLLVSFSGGRTSAYMSRLLKECYADKYELLFIFANTGEEHENTLIFVDRCDKEFGLGVVWVEAVVAHGQRKGTGFRVVNYETASRSGIGGPFEDVISKYGIPNRNFPHCTRELKLRPIYAYADSVGWEKGSYQIAVGIRADEARRLRSRAKDDGIVYPLAHWHPVDKQDINDWWADQPFNLELKERWGNCKTCWKKSDKKLFANIDENVGAFEFNRQMEAKYPHTGAGSTGEPRVFFRLGRSTNRLIAQKIMSEGYHVKNYEEDEDADGGCSESCEAFGAEQMELFDHMPI